MNNDIFNKRMILLAKSSVHNSIIIKKVEAFELRNDCTTEQYSHLFWLKNQLAKGELLQEADFLLQNESDFFEDDIYEIIN